MPMKKIRGFSLKPITTISTVSTWLTYASGGHYPWFTNEDSIILLPKEYNLEHQYHHLKTIVDEWKGNTQI